MKSEERFDNITWKKTLSVVEMMERYENGEYLFMTGRRMTSLPAFANELRRKPDYLVFPPLSDQAKWDAQKQSRLIESFLINFPVPPILLYQLDENSYEVIDGRQRITAIREFYDNKLVLTGLELWPELNGMRYRDLSVTIQSGLRNKSLWSISIFKNPYLPEEFALRLRENAFEVLIKEEVKLEKQEIRKALYLYPGGLNALILKLSELDVFRNAWHLPQYDVSEENGSPKEAIFNIPFYQNMPHLEVILRFFALRHLEHYQPGIQQFLDRYTMRSRNFTPNDISFLEALYVRTINLAAGIYGNLLFRAYLPDKQSWSNQPQIPVYDGLMVALTTFLDEAETLIDRREQVIAETINLFVNHEPGTFTSPNEEKTVIENRINLFRAMLRRVLDE